MYFCDLVPRDCGPEGYVGSEWNSRAVDRGEKDFAFYVWNDNPHSDPPTYSPTKSPAPSVGYGYPHVQAYEAKRLSDSDRFLLAYDVHMPEGASIDYRNEQTIYDVDYKDELMNSFSVGFDRIAYYVELDSYEYGPQWIWISMDSFSDDLNDIGVPTFASDAAVQQEVSGMNVYSSVEGLVANGQKGYLEFWPNNYGSYNKMGVEGASDSRFDFGDDRSTGGSYGSMQVHSLDLKKTLFAYNNWNSGNGVDLGIGQPDNPNSNDDWTFTRNGGIYTTKKIQIFVRPAPTMAPTASSAPSVSAAPTRMYSEVMNLALDQETYASSTCHGGKSPRAVDGKTDGNDLNWNSGSVYHSCKELGAYWGVYLYTKQCLISGVTIYNRGDCCQSRSDGLEVQILDEAGNVVASQTLEGSEPVYELDFGEVIGSEVKIKHPDTKEESINIAEVLVFGQYPITKSPTLSPTVSAKPSFAMGPLHNIALNQPAQQSCNYLSNQYLADIAVDGDKNGSVMTHTCNGYGNWWEVTLPVAEKNRIESITVYNRMSCCSSRLFGAELQLRDVDDNILAIEVIPSFSSESVTFDFSDIVGVAKVKVQHTQDRWDVISLVEVVVMGRLALEQ
jgi:hypothetical protein